MAEKPDDTSPAFLGVERSVTGRRWRERSADPRRAAAISQRLAVPEIIGRILAGRGVTFEDSDGFLNPTLKSLLPDPSRFADMDKAAARIVRAIRQKEKIAVFGDYDVDGATSSALLARYFGSIDVPLRIYIPDRQREGYGPNTAALLKLKDEGIKVVITVDCGTLAFAPLEAAAGAGLDVVVADHHLAETRLPDCFAVINPNRIDFPTPAYGHIAAVGVVFLLVIAINRALRNDSFFSEVIPEPNLLEWLDLVALGTVCDVVPLTGLNRAFVAQGLKTMGGRRNPGLAALADIAGMAERPGVYHLGYLLGPRVNAGGRVGRSDLGARLLSTDDPEEARKLSAELNRLNIERRAIEAEVEAEARAILAMRDETAAVTVIAREGWHQGVIGIVASRIKELTNRPTFIIAIEDGIGKGSGRSVPGVDLGGATVAALQAGLLLNGGGHAMAAGLTIRAEQIAEFERFLGDRLGGAVARLGNARSLGVDGAISLSAASTDFLELLEKAGPYGAGHPEPRFAFADVRLSNAFPVGEKHLSCTIEGASGSKLKAIAFRAFDGPMGPALERARREGGSIHLAGSLRADNWRGQKRVQFFIDDMAEAIPGRQT